MNQPTGAELILYDILSPVYYLLVAARPEKVAEVCNQIPGLTAYANPEGEGGYAFHHGTSVDGNIGGLIRQCTELPEGIETTVQTPCTKVTVEDVIQYPGQIGAIDRFEEALTDQGIEFTCYGWDSGESFQF